MRRFARPPGFLAAAFALSCAAETAEPEPEPIEITHQGASYTLILTMNDAPREGPNDLLLEVVRTSDRSPAEGAELVVTAAMPTMPHGTVEDATVEPVAPGLFQVQDLIFSMPGRWEVEASVTEGAAIERAYFAMEVY
jgi:hypothetical protein